MALTDTGREGKIGRYEGGPALLRAALAKVPEQARKWRPGPGKWSVHEVICHCADSETNAYARIRFLVAEDSPSIQGYDQDRWAQVFDYHSLPLEPALATVDAVRASTAALLRRLPAAAWTREGTHSQSGRYTAETWLDSYAGHLEKHSRQIERNLAAWEAAGRPGA